MVCKNYYAHDFVFLPVNSGTALLNRWMLHLKMDVRPAATGLDRPETPKKKDQPGASWSWASWKGRDSTFAMFKPCSGAITPGYWILTLTSLLLAASVLGILISRTPSLAVRSPGS